MFNDTISILFPDKIHEQEDEQENNLFCSRLILEIIDTFTRINNNQVLIFIISQQSNISENAFGKLIAILKNTHKAISVKRPEDYKPYEELHTISKSQLQENRPTELLRSSFTGIRKTIIFESDKTIYEKARDENFTGEKEYFLDMIESAYASEAGSTINAKTIQIKIFYGCTQIMMNLTNNYLIGHLIIYKKTAKNCFSTMIINNTNQIIKKTSMSSLTIISDESYTTNDYFQEDQLGHFFIDRQIYKITKNILHDYYQTPIRRWTRYYCNPPVCFFSYGEKDEQHEYMESLANTIKRYFPPIIIKKDKAIENYGIDIEKVSQLLYNSDVVYFIIGTGFLHSFYAMREITRVFKRKFSIDYNDSQFKTMGKIDNYFEKGFIVIILDDAKKLIYTDNNDLEEIWISIQEKNKELNEYKIEEVEEIVDNIGKIKHLLNKAYSYNSAEKHYEEGFKSIAYITSIAISKTKKRYYHNFYGNYTPSQFPAI